MGRFGLIGVHSPMQNALVTGATSGIGAAVVRSLSGKGLNVLAVARRAERLAEIEKETGCKPIAADVRDIDMLARQIDQFEPDIVVNNAGVGHGISGLTGLSASAIQEAFDINAVAPIQISAVAIEGMRKRNRGHIVNIGSIAGLHTLISALYGGTKAAVHQFSQNLRSELKGTGIRVTEICPGRVASDFYDVAQGDESRLASMKQSGIRDLQPEDIADCVLFALNAPSHVNVATIEVLPTEQSVGGVAATPVGETI